MWEPTGNMMLSHKVGTDRIPRHWTEISSNTALYDIRIYNFEYSVNFHFSGVFQEY